MAAAKLKDAGKKCKTVAISRMPKKPRLLDAKTLKRSIFNRWDHVFGRPVVDENISCSIRCIVQSTCGDWIIESVCIQRLKFEPWNEYAKECEETEACDSQPTQAV